MRRVACGLAAAGLLLGTGSAMACAPGRAAADAPVALVFSGGGAKSAWEAGVAVALVEGGAPIRVAAGSSAGALNAAMLADGRLEHLERVWRSVTREQVYRLRASVFLSGLLPGWLTLLALDGAGSLLDPGPLRQLLEASLDLPRVRASPLRVVVVATDLARGQRRVFDNATLTVDALLAAGAVPGAFPPVEIAGEALVDGGLVGRAPVLEALETGVPLGRALILLSSAREAPGPPPTRLRAILESAFELTMVHQMRRDAELAALRHPTVDVQVLAPSKPLGVRPLDFEPEALGRLFDLGRADGRACLEALRGGR